MIDVQNFRDMLSHLGFIQDGNSVASVMRKSYANNAHELAVDFTNQKIIYPEYAGLKIHHRTTCNFSASENAVVFECVERLLAKGYKPEHIELEPAWRLGHNDKAGRADILVRDQLGTSLLIIECKTAGREFDKAWKDTLADGAQLVSYVKEETATQFICLYASEFDAKASELKLSQKIVSVKDNAKILEDNPKALSFKAATNAVERFKVWKETYQQEYTETGIFEGNIQPYQIGKNNYTLLDDTKPLGASDIKGAYHRFRTILRKHNVSRRENAFEVLVNLFLCKIVDELENPNNLKFYWKGIAYDNYFDLVDRLQSLYKIGMERFLNQDIVYISNDEIDSAFWAIQQKRNATKVRIKEIFRELKFYKGLDFEFIKVFNKTYFDKNAKILLEIIQMWQGLRLTDSGQNQFLGDMFEFFLDNGIKQSEGQFFTPVPICKFVVSSLPLEQLLAQHSEPLRAIDYACGSGHFLTEYAQQLPALLQTHKNLSDTSSYHAHIYGIEKEDRLAKVAKVSAFMYGFKEIQVIDADALVRHPNIKEQGFQLLVANPPFAVEDFLLTVPEEERERFELLRTVSDLGNRNVQCFFLERAQQLLAPGGVMGVIVPSSILSNTDGMHTATRELLLKHFDFVSIAELGGQTFGKTGTNTVVLFLRRKVQRPEPAEHYWNRTLDFFDNWGEELKSAGGAYQDLDVVRHYCTHAGLDFDAYQSLLAGQPSDALRQQDLFKDYQRAFDASAEVRKLKDNKAFLRQSTESQATDLAQRFAKYCAEVEKTKLYHFMLAYSNPTPVLLVKPPADNKLQKQFLGYEWSGAKGSEGIQYSHGDTVQDIQTPLFDPKNRDNKDKISQLIRANFEGQALEIGKDLQPYVTQANLVDLLEFGRVEFDKVISLSPKNTTSTLSSQWQLVRLADVAEIQSGGTPDSNNADYWDGDIFWATLVDTKEKFLQTTQRKITELGLKNSSAKLLPIGTVIFSSRATIGEVCIAKVPVATNQGYKNFICDITKISPEFLYEVLKQKSNDIAALASGTTFKEISKSVISNFKIPLPPLSTQQKIITECDAVDAAVEQARAVIAQNRSDLAQLLLAKGQGQQEKLANMAQRVSINIDPQQQLGAVNYIGLENIEAHTGQKVGETLTDYASIKSAKTQFKAGDLLYGKLRPNLNKVYLAQEDGICSTDIYVLRFASAALTRLYAHWLRSEPFNTQVLATVSGQQLPRTSWSAMGQVMVPVFAPAEQSELISAIEVIEATTVAAQFTIAAAPAQRQAILNKYL